MYANKKTTQSRKDGAYFEFLGIRYITLCWLHPPSEDEVFVLSYVFCFCYTYSLGLVCWWISTQQLHSFLLLQWFCLGASFYCGRYIHRFAVLITIRTLDTLFNIVSNVTSFITELLNLIFQQLKIKYSHLSSRHKWNRAHFLFNRCIPVIWL